MSGKPQVGKSEFIGRAMREVQGGAREQQECRKGLTEVLGVGLGRPSGEGLKKLAVSNGGPREA